MWASLLGYFLAKALDVPFWRDWEIGDGFDFAVASGMLVLALTSERKP